ncbi:transcriptional repressor tcf25 [Cyclospora cayetanensis]|uniref:Transcriptional repressor tcf25 n=1 Tax=Cyclospora cayetanensis TaxID=88456 RepID=A0A1D3D9C7_9EIME|nr:transcriptional repressor tcf25 [Cyclospora cayetanensis]
MSLRQLRKVEGRGACVPETRSSCSRSCLKSHSEESSSDESLNGSLPGTLRRSRPGVFLQALGSDFQVSEAEEQHAEAAVEEGGLKEEDAESSAESDSKDPHEEPGTRSQGPAAEAKEAAEIATESRREENLSRCAAVQHGCEQQCNGRRLRKRRKRRPVGAFLSAAPADHDSPPEAPTELESPSLAASAEAPGQSEPSQGAMAVTSCLSMERSAFDPETDLIRLFGREVVRTSRTAFRGPSGCARARRYWLLSPPGPQGTVLNPWVRMVGTTDQSTGNWEFSLQFSEDYIRVQPAFFAAVHSHDPLALRQFCRDQPLHPDGLLALAQSLGVAGNHEMAHEVVRQAVLSLQAAFHYAFSPFLRNADGTPQVSVDSLNPLNRQLFVCLLLYMLGLGDQGGHGSALEICKLLLSMDLSYDPCHALLHLDHFAIRSRKYAFLQRFSQEFVKQHLTYVVSLTARAATAVQADGSCMANTMQEEIQEQGTQWEVSDLRCALPNFAFSAALASFMHTEKPEIHAIKHIGVRDICGILRDERECIAERSGAASVVAHCLLMHAILLFPAFVRRLLQKLQIKGEQTINDSIYPQVPWDALIFSAPLWSSDFPCHKTEDAAHDLLIQCFIERNHELWHYGALREHKALWSKSVILMDLRRYTEARISEFTRHPTLPTALMDMEGLRRQTGRREGRLRQHLSLRSTPLLLFFQTMLPWNELDHTGLHAEPMYLSNVFSGLWSFFSSVFAAGVSVLRRLGARTIVRGTPTAITARDVTS